MSQVQQFQLEVRQLQQTLIVKQDELTQLNRDNERLLTEARQLHRDQQAQQRLLDQKAQALEGKRTGITPCRRVPSCAAAARSERWPSASAGA